MVQQKRGSDVLGDRVLGQTANLIQCGGANHDIGSADKPGIQTRLSRADGGIKEGLLIVGPPGDRVFVVAVVLTGLYPGDGRVGKGRYRLQQKLRSGDHVRIEERDQCIVRRADLLTRKLDIPGLCAASDRARHTNDAQALRQLLHVLPAGSVRHTPVIADDNRHRCTGKSVKILGPCRNRPGERCLENFRSLVHGWDENKDRVL